MGIDISGFGRAKRISGRHSFARCEEEGHYAVGANRRFLDGLKPGCYVRGTKSVYIYLSYASFDTWINSLSAVVFRESARTVSAHPEQFEGRAFFELISLPESNDIGIGPATSAKLYADFSRHAAKVKEGLQRLAREAAKLRSKGRTKTRKKKSTRTTSAALQEIATALGGFLVGGEDDPNSIRWEWKWETYRDFRRAFKAASDDGLVLVSI